jgi:peptidoglycan/LPS O-acetylase OafA/YrhL
MREESIKKETRFVILDSLRGLAAILVFLFHCALGTPLQNSILRLGATGVDLFFIISGFVILLTLQHTTRGLAFVANRFFKLYPVYWVIVSFTALLILVKDQHGIDTRLFPEYLGNLTMLQRYFGIRNLDEQYWTLEVELIFYALMLIIFLTGRLKSIEKTGLWACHSFL